MVTRTKPATAAGLAAEIKPRPTTRGKKVSYPGCIEPALATLRRRPPVEANWLHEIKFDGYRLQARIRPRQVRLLTRSGLDWTAKFAGADLPVEEAVIDGEVVAQGSGGAPDFSALQDALATGTTERLVFLRLRYALSQWL